MTRSARKNDWIPIIDRSASSRRPWWSPDGNLLYFLSNLDGFECIWAQRLEPATKRPDGEPFAISHFHSARNSMRLVGTANFGPAVSPDRIVFSLNELSGNIWVAETEQQN